jgi:SAM-dependent methyltransferase
MGTMDKCQNKRFGGNRGRTCGRRTTGHVGVVLHRNYWLVPVVVLGATVLYRNRLRAYLKQVSANVRAFDLPTAGMYDALVATVLEGFYARVANEVAAAHPSGKVLEIGSGPGQLTVQFAREAPGIRLTGVDISDAMVERAARRAPGAGLSERVRFEVGDVGALPLPDQEFDGVVSTLSLHHWSDPAGGLAEICRVLKPGGEARIYDLAHWLWPPVRGGNRLARLAAASPFGEGEVEIVHWPGSVPAFVLLRLRRARKAQL